VSVPRGTVASMAVVVERDPSHCPNGHPLGPNQVTKGWLPCQCVEGATGHRTWYWRTCGVTMYEPPHEHVDKSQSTSLRRYRV